MICAWMGDMQEGYNPGMSEEIGVREDVSVLVTLELSLAESRVSHVKVREK